MTAEARPEQPSSPAPAKLELPRQLFQEIVSHARRESPKEACGLVAGKAGLPTAVVPIDNIDPFPVVRYTMAPKGVIAFDRQLDEHGWEWFAVYHSHTFSEAYPSPTDVANAVTVLSPGLLYLIVTLKDENEEREVFSLDNPGSLVLSLKVRTLSTPALRAFTIENGQVEELPVTIV